MRRGGRKVSASRPGTTPSVTRDRNCGFVHVGRGADDADHSSRSGEFRSRTDQQQHATGRAAQLPLDLVGKPRRRALHEGLADSKVWGFGIA